MQHLLSKTLIKKFLAQECTVVEKKFVSEALNTSDGQRLLNEVLQEQWEAATDAADPSDNQLLEWKKELHQRIKIAEERKVVSFFSSNLFRYAGISAAALVCIALLFTLKLNAPKANNAVAMRHIANPFGKMSMITLPDSTVVYLGAGSKLSFPETFAKDKRDISLEGEAFFDVKHKPQQAFIVHTGNLQTRDIGTSFKITAFKNTPVTVALASGEVSVESVNGKTVTVLAHLRPGQQSLWNNGKLITGTISVNDITGWKDGNLVFDGVPLSELTGVLERWYNVKISYNSDVRKGLLVTTRLTVAKTSITSIMQALSMLEHFTYKIEGKQITIN